MGRSFVEEVLDLIPELVAHGLEYRVVRGTFVDHELMRPAVLVLELLDVREWRRRTGAAPELEEWHTTRRCFEEWQIEPFEQGTDWVRAWDGGLRPREGCLLHAGEDRRIGIGGGRDVSPRQA